MLGAQRPNFYEIYIFDEFQPRKFQSQNVILASMNWLTKKIQAHIRKTWLIDVQGGPLLVVNGLITPYKSLYKG